MGRAARARRARSRRSRDIRDVGEADDAVKRRARRSVIRRAGPRIDETTGRRDERAARERNYAHAFERAWGAGYAR